MKIKKTKRIIGLVVIGVLAMSTAAFATIDSRSYTYYHNYTHSKSTVSEVYCHGVSTHRSYLNYCDDVTGKSTTITSAWTGGQIPSIITVKTVSTLITGYGEYR